MKKFNIKKLAIFCLIILLNFNISLAFSIDTRAIYNYFVNGTAKDVNFTDITNSVLGIVVFLGYAISICMILFTGIQFLIATPQKKAQLKEKLWLILVGVVILAGGVSIIAFASGIMHGMFSPTTAREFTKPQNGGASSKPSFTVTQELM